jgi:two-component system sensor histidine kinase MprB
MTTAKPVRHPRLSLRARVALLAGVAVALAIFVTTVGIYLSVRNQLYSQLDQDMLTRAQTTAGAVSSPDQLLSLPPELLGGASVGWLEPGLPLPYVGEDQPPVSDAERAVANGDASQSIRGASTEAGDVRVVAVPVKPGVALVWAGSTESVDNTLRQVGLISLVIGLLGIAAAATAGYGVARAGLAPLGSLTRATEHVAETTDLTPIAEPGDDEIGRLARSFNAMLASLSAARERERQLVADAGHELRTPLTSLRTNLDLLAQAENSSTSLAVADREELLADVRQQVQELGVLVNDLMQLSVGPEPVKRIEVDLAAITRDSLERVQRRAQSMTFDVRLTPWLVNGDAVMLERAVTNLLDNAAKWTPADGVVEVTLEAGVLSVSDSGPGIRPEDRAKIFERFYRSPTARATPGSGLGLAIVAQVVSQHSGQITVGDSRFGGAKFDVWLPGKDPANDGANRISAS